MFQFLASSSSDENQIKSSSDEETIDINSIPSFSQIDDIPIDIEVPESLIMESNNTEISVVSTDSSTDEINQAKNTPKNLLNLNFNEESWVEIYQLLSIKDSILGLDLISSTHIFSVSALLPNSLDKLDPNTTM